MYDLLIIGGGPGGVAAGVYAARKKLKTVLVADGFGGQSLVSSEIQNWIGDKKISGFELAQKLEDHLRSYQGAGFEIWDGDRVASVRELPTGGFQFTTQKGKTDGAHAVLVCSGSRRRRLGVPGEDRLDSKGVAWCATCDAPLFKDKVVAVVGGGNAGLESVLDLKEYASKIYLLHRGNQLKGDPVTQEKVKQIDKVTVIYNALTAEILGDQFVSGIKYKDAVSGEEKILEVGGVFVEIGSVPNVEFLGGMVQLNQYNEIIIDCATQKTSKEGIWAAGDVSTVLYKQNNISVGDAVKAVLNIVDFLHKNNKK